MSDTPTGWFADLSDEEDRDERWPYQPFVQLGAGCFPLPIWFKSEQECERFILAELVGLPALDD